MEDYGQENLDDGQQQYYQDENQMQQGKSHKKFINLSFCEK